MEMITQSVEDARRKASVKSAQDVQLQLYLLGSGRSLDADYDHGRHALQISVGDQQFTLRNTLPIERNYTFERLEERVCTEVDRDETCFDDDDVSVQYLPVIHIGTHRNGEGYVERYRGRHTQQFSEDAVLEQLPEALSVAQERLINALTDE